MRSFLLLLLSLSILACEQENVEPLELDFNTDVYFNADFVSQDTMQEMRLVLNPWNEAHHQNFPDFEREGNPSLVAFLGGFFPSEAQVARDCYTITPLTSTEEELADAFPYFSHGATVFMEYIGLQNGREDCRFDQSTTPQQLRLGTYPLGQEHGQIHFHVYGTEVPARWAYTDFYLSNDIKNEGLFVEITELDFDSWEFTGVPGVYVSFQVPLAYGFHSVSEEVYEMRNVEGRLFFPLLPY